MFDPRPEIRIAMRAGSVACCLGDMTRLGSLVKNLAQVVL
jgi:hypothetical protein